MASSSSKNSLAKPITENEENFRRKLLSTMKIMTLIENEDLKKETLDCIPAYDLTVKATQLLSQSGDCLEECLIFELLKWFKFSFFSWVDSPKCQFCAGSTSFKGSVPPTPEELIWYASGTENFQCDNCSLYTRFPRYNHPKKLLETKRGRCGEWAICFCQICRALDLDVRLVIEWNDHAWVEMRSPSKQRWIHCDPCENIIDKPLLYEAGWKKKIYLVVAFSKDEVQDVTWRYTQNFSEVLKRRKDYELRESYVLDLINYHTKNCRMNMSPDKVRKLCKRQTLELADFLSPPKNDTEHLGGRLSGSMAWRLNRGEATLENTHIPFVFDLCENETKNKYFHIKYNCAADEYVRISNNSSRSKSWQSLAFKIKDMFRKHEQDWNVAYLCRMETSSKGLVVWKFDFEKSGLVIRSFKIHLMGRTFETGKITWYLSPINSVLPQVEKISTDANISYTDEVLKDFKGATGFSIMAELSGGEGQIAWQHAQLFRENCGTQDNLSFEIEVFFK